MKKIVTAFLCALLLLVLPVMAAQLDAPPSAAIETPTAHALPVATDVVTDLKLQQQKLEFFKERLQMQDDRIGDLGLMIAVFSILLTFMMVFFSFRSKTEAVGAARDEAQKEIKQRTKEYIETSLRPEVDKVLKDIREDAQKLNAQSRALNDELAASIGKPQTPEQKKRLTEAINNLESVPPKEYRSSDWTLLGIQAYEQGKYHIAVEHFSRAAEIAESSADRANALISKGITLSRLQRHEEAIAVYDEILKGYGETSEATLREQVAMALVNKSNELRTLQRHEKAITVCNEVVKRYGEAPEAALRESVAMALLHKGVTLGELQRHEEAIAVYDEVVKRYGDAPETALRDLVAKARDFKNHKPD